MPLFEIHTRLIYGLVSLEKDNLKLMYDIFESSTLIRILPKILIRNFVCLTHLTLSK